MYNFSDMMPAVEAWTKAAQEAQASFWGNPVAWMPAEDSDTPMPWMASKTAPDVLKIGRSIENLSAAIAEHPETLLEVQTRFGLNLMASGAEGWKRMFGLAAEQVAPDQPGDRRFKDPAWADNPVFANIKEAYLS